MDTASLAVTGDSMASLSTLITAALRGDRRDHSITHRVLFIFYLSSLRLTHYI